MKDIIIKKIDELLESGEKVFKTATHRFNIDCIVSQGIRYYCDKESSYYLYLSDEYLVKTPLSNEDAKTIHMYLKSKYDAAELERKKTKEEQNAEIINEYFGLGEEQSEATLAQKAVDFKIQDDEFKFSHIQKETEGGLILATIHRDYMKEIEGKYFSRPRNKETILDENGSVFFIDEKIIDRNPHKFKLIPSKNNTKEIDINQLFICECRY